MLVARGTALARRGVRWQVAHTAPPAPGVPAASAGRTDPRTTRGCRRRYAADDLPRRGRIMLGVIVSAAFCQLQRPLVSGQSVRRQKEHGTVRRETTAVLVPVGTAVGDLARKKSQCACSPHGNRPVRRGQFSRKNLRYAVAACSYLASCVSLVTRSHAWKLSPKRARVGPRSWAVGTRSRCSSGVPSADDLRPPNVSPNRRRWRSRSRTHQRPPYGWRMPWHVLSAPRVSIAGFGRRLLRRKPRCRPLHDESKQGQQDERRCRGHGIPRVRRVSGLFG